MTNTASFFYSTPYKPHESKFSIGAIGAQSYLDSIATGELTSLNSEHIDLASIFRARKAIARSIKFYGARLAKMDPVSFKYRTKNERQALEEELLNTLYLLYDECQLHLLEGNHALLLQRGKQLERCANMLYRLRNTPPMGEHPSPEQILQENLDASPDKPAKYIALIEIAPLIAKNMLRFTADQGLASVQETISAANAYRLDWVWSGGLDRALLDLIPGSVGQTQQAKDAFANIAPVTGYMSFIFHFTCLGIELSLLTKATLKGSWITGSDKTLDVGLWERFTTQLDMRKFAILNYGLWAPANMACFFILVGNGTLGWIGNGLLGGLLVVDFVLACWNYREKKAEYESVLQQFDDDILELTTRINSASDENNENKKEVLSLHKKTLESAKAEWISDWTFDNEKMTRGILYAGALFASVAIMCCFFFPPATMVPATLLILGVVGSALSFLVTLVYNMAVAGTECKKWQRLCEDTKKTIESTTNQEEQAALTKDLIYQQEMVEFHKIQSVQQAFLQALIPASAFGLLVFANVGLPVVLPVTALLILTSEFLKGQKSAEPDSPGFEEINTPLVHKF